MNGVLLGLAVATAVPLLWVILASFLSLRLLARWLHRAGEQTAWRLAVASVWGAVGLLFIAQLAPERWLATSPRAVVMIAGHVALSLAYLPISLRFLLQRLPWDLALPASRACQRSIWFSMVFLSATPSFLGLIFYTLGRVFVDDYRTGRQVEPILLSLALIFATWAVFYVAHYCKGRLDRRLEHDLGRDGLYRLRITEAEADLAAAVGYVTAWAGPIFLAWQAFSAVLPQVALALDRLLHGRPSQGAASFPEPSRPRSVLVFAWTGLLLGVSFVPNVAVAGVVLRLALCLPAGLSIEALLRRWPCSPPRRAYLLLATAVAITVVTAAWGDIAGPSRRAAIGVALTSACWLAVVTVGRRTVQPVARPSEPQYEEYLRWTWEQVWLFLAFFLGGFGMTFGGCGILGFSLLGAVAWGLGCVWARFLPLPRSLYLRWVAQALHDGSSAAVEERVPLHLRSWIDQKLGRAGDNATDTQ